MAEKGSFLFRTNPKMLAALKGWAEDEFRSTNGQLEFILREALKEAGRLPGPEAGAKGKPSSRR